MEKTHTERQALSRDGDVYVIHSHSGHQQTRAAQEAPSEERLRSGRLGHRPPKVRPTDLTFETQARTYKASRDRMHPGG